MSFLDSLDSESRELLLSVARPVSYDPTAILMRHGEPARGAYIVDSGTVEAVVTLPGGESLTVATLGPGSVLGEMALIELGTCTATVTAGLLCPATSIETSTALPIAEPSGTMALIW